MQAPTDWNPSNRGGVPLSLSGDLPVWLTRRSLDEARALRVPLPRSDGADWVPWIGRPSIDELKHHVWLALESYRGPEFAFQLGGQTHWLYADAMPSLMAAVERCDPHDADALADLWRLLRGNDTASVEGPPSGWPSQPFLDRLAPEGEPVIGRLAPPDGLPAATLTRRAVRPSTTDGMALNDARWLDAFDPATPARRDPLHIERRLEALGAWRARWEALRLRSNGLGAGFDEILEQARANRGGFALLCIGPPHAPETLAAVIHGHTRKSFKLGERLLGTWSLHQAHLVGGHVLGAVDAARLSRLLRVTRRLFDTDLVHIREIEVASPTYRSARLLSAPWIVSSHSRVDQLHWTLDLPDSFEAYLNGLSTKTRQSVRYSMRKVEKELNVRIDKVTRIEQVDDFLRAAESISRCTYQWQVGERVCFDDPTRTEYRRRAHAGTLRAYLLSVDGRPVAFARGMLRGTVYDYETPGYLPEFGKWSIGTVLMMHVIEDLIRSRSCRVFDFGDGGDAVGYKSRFGNRSVPVRALDVAGIGQWRGQAFVALQGALALVKNTAQMVLGQSETKRRIKAWLRR